jgi:hypothetical protein
MTSDFLNLLLQLINDLLSLLLDCLEGAKNIGLDLDLVKLLRRKVAFLENRL